MVGGVVGIALFPIVGTIIGAGISTAVGGVFGFIWGACSERKEECAKVEIKV